MKVPEGKIAAEWFYENEEGKTKLNWFLYEVALEYQMYIKDAAELKAFRKEQGDRSIASFCTHFAKRMKQSVLERLEGMTEATIIYDEYITDFYPQLRQDQVDMLMDAAGKAWDSHMTACEACPTRCISEKDEKCFMFDSYKARGLL